MKEHMYSRPRLLDKGRARYRRERRRDPSLPPLRHDAGKVEVTDAIRVIFPTLDGKVIYTAAPVGGWRFAFDSQSSNPRAVAAGAWAKLDADALFDLFLGLERQHLEVGRVLAGLERKISAFEAKHSHNNVVHLNNIAAE
jgi:hypothetical protein